MLGALRTLGWSVEAPKGDFVVVRRGRRYARGGAAFPQQRWHGDAVSDGGGGAGTGPVEIDGNERMREQPWAN